MASVDMFGTGGEALGGLFTGQQAAQAQNLNEAQVAQQQAAAAHANALAQGTDISNQYEQAILGDKIKAYQQAAMDKQLASKEAQFKKQGEQFGQLGTVLSNMPAAARPAALQKMANDLGVSADNPMLQHMSSMDPEQLPDAMAQFSSHFYEQSDAARAEKQKRDAMLAQNRETLASREQIAADQVAQRREAAADRNATLAAIAAMREGGQNSRAAARAGAKGGPADVLQMAASGKITPEKLASYYDIKEAQEGLTPQEEQARANARSVIYNKATVGKPGTTEDIMGLPSPAERVEAAATGKAPVKKGTQQFQEGKIYQDASGNKARYENGKWVPMGGPAIPK